MLTTVCVERPPKARRLLLARLRANVSVRLASRVHRSILVRAPWWPIKLAEGRVMQVKLRLLESI
jgi:hypothetical protein